MLISVKEDPSNPFKVPFPQANDLDKILDLIIFFSDNRKTCEQISKYLKLNGR